MCQEDRRVDPIAKISICYRGDSRLLCVHATSQAAFVDSDRLSKSKPLGILRLAPIGIILTADDA
jgi:hypothetical protein